MAKLAIKTLLLIAAILFSANSRAELKITVTDIKEISLDEVGILDNKNGGLASDIWNNSSYKLIANLLAGMPPDIKSPTIIKLQKRLLLTTAVPPKNIGTNLSISDLRLKLLAKLGYSRELRQLVRLIPENMRTEEIDQILASSFFINNDYKSACKQIEGMLAKYDSLFWYKVQIICSAFNRQENEVNFSLSLLKEDGKSISDNFIRIAKKMLIDRKAASSEWSAILTKVALKIPNIKKTLPDFDLIKSSELSKTTIVKFFKENKTAKIHEKTNNAAQLFAIIDAAGAKIRDNEWNKFIDTSISHNHPIPAAATMQLLDIYKKNNQTGATILLIIHAIRDKKVADIPPHLLARILQSINYIGLKDEAAQLASEL